MFVGATDVAASVPLAIFASLGRWNPGRLVMPIILSFTACVLLIWLLGAGLLLWDRFGTDRWMALDVILPISTALHPWWYRRWPAAAAQPTPLLWRWSLSLQGVALGRYGLAMVAAPLEAMSWWPWPIRGFNGRMYAANSPTFAVGSLLLSRVGSRLERVTFGLNRMNWGAPTTFAWLALFAAIAIIGGGLALSARAGREALAAPRRV